jgi:hypothetical protein
MDAVRLRVVFDGEVMASIICDGSQGGHEDYYSVVFVKGFIENNKIYGVDPVQSFALGWTLINDLTTDLRVGDEDLDTCEGASWRIESF